MKNEVASNAIVLESTIYVITDDASLRAYQLNGGKEVGRIQMDIALLFNGRTRSSALQLNTRDKIIYAYYGDTREIIAFKQIK